MTLPGGAMQPIKIALVIAMSAVFDSAADITTLQYGYDAQDRVATVVNAATGNRSSRITKQPPAEFIRLPTRWDKSNSIRTLKMIGQRASSI
jgi:hypothetical protein